MKNGFPKGAIVYLDGQVKARVREFYPKGSTSYLFPHYRLDVHAGDKNIAVNVNRVGVVKRP